MRTSCSHWLTAQRLTDQSGRFYATTCLDGGARLGVGSWAPAQTTSSSSSPQQLPLPAAPRSPKSLAECDAYQKRLDDQMAQISQQHSACLESFKEDRQGDNNLICSRSECQNLHTLLYGPHKTAGEQQVASCQAASRDIKRARRLNSKEYRRWETRLGISSRRPHPRPSIHKTI